MAKEKAAVTIRVRVGDSEFEVTGPSDFVEKKIEEFLKTGPAALRTPAAATPTPPVTGHSVSAKGKSPAQFFRTFNSKTDTDRVLIAAYYLEKFRNAQNATAAEIRDLIREARIPPPKNTSDAINKNIRKGVLMTAGDRESKMTFVVTSDGESLVDELASKARG